MNNEFFEALQMLEREKGIKADYLIEKITNAIVIAVKKDYEVADNVTVVIDPDNGRFSVSITKMVVDIVEVPETEILLDEALAYDPKAKVGFPCVMHLDTKKFGRIAAQTAKHVIRQGIREAERSQMLEQFQEKVCEIVTATVQKIEPQTGNATVEIDHNEFLLFKNDQLPSDELHEGDRIKVYVVDVVNLDRRCSLKISRTHKDLVKRLFELEVPEIYDGTIEVKSISREAGTRTKIAVMSHNPDVDPIGACVGPERQPYLGHRRRAPTARRSTSSAIRRTTPPSSRRPSPPPPSWTSRSCRAPNGPAGSPSRITSSRWPSATRARTPSWPPN